MAQVDVPTGTWQIDPVHSSVTFWVRHMMVSKVRGRFSSFSGTITTTDDPHGSSVEASIDVSSIDTNDPQRDGHLRSPDFFDAEAHPTMTFRSTGLEHDGEEHRLTGELTIKGVTKPITLDLELGGVGKEPMMGTTRIGVTGTGTLNRKDFGLEWNAPLETGGVLIGEKITVDLDIEGVLQTQPATV